MSNINSESALTVPTEEKPYRLFLRKSEDRLTLQHWIKCRGCGENSKATDSDLLRIAVFRQSGEYQCPHCGKYLGRINASEW